MKLQSTLSNHESMMNDKNLVAGNASHSRRIAGEEIALLSGELGQKYPFVARSFGDYLPQRRTTVRKANKAPGARLVAQHLDNELIHLSAYFMEFASNHEEPHVSRPVAMNVAPVPVYPSARRANPIFAAMAAAMGVVAVALTLVLLFLAPATASELAAGAQTRTVSR